jgi:hypothetical protein
VSKNLENPYVFRAHIGKADFLAILWHWSHGYSATETQRILEKKGTETSAKVSRKTIEKYFHHIGQRVFLVWVLRTIFNQPPRFSKWHEYEDWIAEIRGNCYVIVRKMSELRRALYKKPDDRLVAVSRVQRLRMLRSVEERARGVRPSIKYAHDEDDRMGRIWDNWAKKRTQHPDLSYYSEDTLDLREPNEQYVLEASSQMRGISEKYFHTYMARAFYLDWRSAEGKERSERSPEKSLYHFLKQEFKNTPLHLAWPVELDVNLLLLLSGEPPADLADPSSQA